MVYRAAISYQMCKQGILADSVNDRQTDIQKQVGGWFTEQLLGIKCVRKAFWLTQ